MRKQYHLRSVCEDTHVWDVHRLVRLSRGIAPRQVPLSDIAELDENWWFQEASQVPSPRAVAAHYALIQATELAHPIILCADGRLMDGMHRVVKALMLQHDNILAVRFDVTPAPDFMNVSLDDLPYGEETI